MALSRGEHAKCTQGTMISDRYKVLKEAGCGNFSKVFKCTDTKHPNQPSVAVKLLKKEYANDAAFENDILRALTEKDRKDRFKVLKLIDHFRWNRHPVFVFPLKGPCLRSRKLGVSRGHVTPSSLMHLSYELLRSLCFLHFDVKMVHTDLKPENILLDKELESDTTPGIGSGWTIVDFGSASFYKPEKLDNDLISTRPYRAPEVVIGNGWSYPADVWSAACILFEVFAGSRLFEVHDDAEHLRQMETRLGALPTHLTKSGKHSTKFFDASGVLLSRGRTPPTASKAPVKAMEEVLHDEPLFCDLLRRMLDFNPKTRLRADAAMEHPYFAPLLAKMADAPTSPSKQKAAEITPRAKPTVTNFEAAKENCVAAAKADVIPAIAKPIPTATPTLALPLKKSPYTLPVSTPSSISISSSRAAAMPPAGKPSGLFRHGTLGPGRYN